MIPKQGRCVEAGNLVFVLGLQRDGICPGREGECTCVFGVIKIVWKLDSRYKVSVIKDYLALPSSPFLNSMVGNHSCSHMCCMISCMVMTSDRL